MPDQSARPLDREVRRAEAGGALTPYLLIKRILLNHAIATASPGNLKFSDVEFRHRLFLMRRPIRHPIKRNRLRSEYQAADKRFPVDLLFIQVGRDVFPDDVTVRGLCPV
jgi:hypothetical protein